MNGLKYQWYRGACYLYQVGIMVFFSKVRKKIPKIRLLRIIMGFIPRFSELCLQEGQCVRYSRSETLVCISTTWTSEDPGTLIQKAWGRA